jgi:hypothetical protein
VPSLGTGASGKPKAEVSAKERDEPILWHLPAILSRTSLLRASSSGIPAEGESLRYFAPNVGRLHLGKKKLSGCAKQKMKKKATACQTRTGGTQQPEM